MAKTGSLPGEHHFYVTFDTRAPGVKHLDAACASSIPEEMTIVLQHQFWDLAVTDTHFEVALSFNGMSEKLHVPLDAIKGFFDPSVQFGLQFETGADAQKAAARRSRPRSPPPRWCRTKSRGESRRAKRKPAGTGSARRDRSRRSPRKPQPAKAPVTWSAKPTRRPEPDKPSGGAEVVRLDRFRKK